MTMMQKLQVPHIIIFVGQSGVGGSRQSYHLPLSGESTVILGQFWFVLVGLQKLVEMQIKHTATSMDDCFGMQGIVKCSGVNVSMS